MNGTNKKKITKESHFAKLHQKKKKKQISFLLRDDYLRWWWNDAQRAIFLLLLSLQNKRKMKANAAKCNKNKKIFSRFLCRYSQIC